MRVTPPALPCPRARSRAVYACDRVIFVSTLALSAYGATRNKTVALQFNGRIIVTRCTMNHSRYATGLPMNITTVEYETQYAEACTRYDNNPTERNEYLMDKAYEALETARRKAMPKHPKHAEG